jgi:hypothetical protein
LPTGTAVAASGLGPGPVAETVNGPNEGAADVVGPLTTPTEAPPVGGPVDFTIVLEVASGAGYP